MSCNIYTKKNHKPHNDFPSKKKNSETNNNNKMFKNIEDLLSQLQQALFIIVIAICELCLYIYMYI